MYTLIGTAKLNDVNPQAWLADVLRRIAGHPQNRLDELLPWNWVPEQRPQSSHINRLLLKTTPLRTHRRTKTAYLPPRSSADAYFARVIVN